LFVGSFFFLLLGFSARTSPGAQSNCMTWLIPNQVLHPRSQIIAISAWHDRFIYFILYFMNHCVCKWGMLKREGPRTVTNAGLASDLTFGSLDPLKLRSGKSWKLYSAHVHFFLWIFFLFLNKI
jgi:hypothetical protein